MESKTEVLFEQNSCLLNVVRTQADLVQKTSNEFKKIRTRDIHPVFISINITLNNSGQGKKFYCLCNFCLNSIAGEFDCMSIFLGSFFHSH